MCYCKHGSVRILLTSNVERKLIYPVQLTGTTSKDNCEYPRGTFRQTYNKYAGQNRSNSGSLINGETAGSCRCSSRLPEIGSRKTCCRFAAVHRDERLRSQTQLVECSTEVLSAWMTGCAEPSPSGCPWPFWRWGYRCLPAERHPDAADVVVQVDC